ncbi:sugar ABC transporter substrate-binding protein [Thermoanaerobacterium thermosulfurigenes]|uniref:sugar ABC transporter substrate-binding protein n=1 Tax=Thermoanaerobacterium thermosulfurigenes TaxID=33950 RepID=UPI003EF6A11B
MKKFLIFLATLLIVFSSMTGCSSKSSTNSSNSSSANNGGSAKKHYVFGYTSMTQNNPYFQVVFNAMKEEIEKHGDKIIMMDPEMDQQKQIDQINNLITQKIDIMLLNPVDWEGVTPALDALKKANIPIVNFDTKVKDMSYVTAYVGSDNKNAGKVCGEDLVKRFPNGGNIVILDSPSMNSINDRVLGFKEAIQGHNFNIVAEQDAKGDLQTAMTKMQDIIQAHPDIIAVFGGNDPTALGALAACKSANFTKPVIYGVDGSPDAKKEIASGSQFVGTGAQSPISIGKLAVEVAYKILNHQPYEKNIPVKTFLINKDNVNQYGTDGWQ